MKETTVAKWEITSYDDSNFIPKNVRKHTFDNEFAFRLVLDDAQARGLSCIVVRYDAEGNFVS